MASGLAKKLNLKDGMKVRVVGKPADVDLGDVAVTTSAKAEGVIVFVKKLVLRYSHKPRTGMLRIATAMQTTTTTSV